MSTPERIRRKIISLKIDEISYQGAIDRITELGKARVPAFVCFANVHMTIEAYSSPVFANSTNHASLVLADGMPLVSAFKSLYGRSIDRVAGMDVLPDLIARAEKDRLKIFFFGTTDEVLTKIRTRIMREHPRSTVVGLFSPPFGSSLDNPTHIKMINDSGANLVFVALGCPKQEKWMANHSGEINAVLLGVGGAFPLYAGETKRAPEFMRRNNLEWVYRLSQEPTRLFRRYLITNSMFIYLMAKAKIKKAISPGS
jgi:N-acetylglucosaminyldiphosphoundecaprenol N-acetyl-beta-D-mannosaminyltransferase